MMRLKDFPDAEREDRNDEDDNKAPRDRAVTAFDQFLKPDLS